MPDRNLKFEIGSETIDRRGQNHQVLPWFFQRGFERVKK